MTALYALRSLAPNTFQMAKFDDADMRVEATYNIIRKGTGYSCDCPASFRSVKTKPCKHQRMVPYMLGACNLPRFFDPDKFMWHDLIQVAPGMQQEHEDGEAAVPTNAPQVQKGVEQRVEPASGRLDAADKFSDDAQPEKAHMNGEPATLATPVAGQSSVGAGGPSPTLNPQPKRPMAPASAAPIVTRRI